MGAKRGYVETADFVRAVTVVSMVAVHTIWFMANGGRWVASGAILSVMHFTRESFMALTGFVLTYSLYGRPIHWIPMLWKRFRLVLYPYLIWSAAYMLLFSHFASVSFFLSRYGANLLYGSAWYHLYYILVTMQFYLVLPLFLALMRVAEKHPAAVVLVAFIAELALAAYDQYGAGADRGIINAHIGEEVWTYTVYFVLGGVGALHWERVQQWLRTHLALVALTGAGTAGIMLTQFFLDTDLGHQMERADAVVQPAMVPWAMTIIILMAALGVRYEDRRRTTPGSLSAVKWAADVSFGIYLIHPMILQYWIGFLWVRHLYHPSYVIAAVTWVILVVGSGLATKLFAMTPISPWTIGRAAIPPGMGRALTMIRESAASRRRPQSLGEQPSQTRKSSGPRRPP